MNALSRREEEFLEKSTKDRAIKECDDLVKGTFRSVLLVLVHSTLSSHMIFLTTHDSLALYMTLHVHYIRMSLMQLVLNYRS